MIDLNDIGAAAFVASRGETEGFVLEQFNTAAERMTGLSATAIVGRPLGEVFAAEVAARLSTDYESCMSARRTTEVERVIAMPLGLIATRTTLTPIFESPGAPVRRLFGVSVDITDQHRLQEDLKSSNARLGIAMEALGGAHWYFDNKKQRFELSPAFDRILGAQAHRDMGIDEWLGHVHPEDRNDTCFADILAGRLEQGTAEFRVFSDTGDVRWLRCRRRAVNDDKAIMGIAGVVLDVTQEKRREATLSLQAASDPLTGLSNRRRFEEVLIAECERAAQRCGPLSLMMIDVDNFKAYNDTYGHVAGDAVLRRLAETIERTVRAEGGTAARYGGEEFIAVLPGKDTAMAAKVADKVLAAIADLREPHRASPAGTVSVSIGVAGNPRVAQKNSGDLVSLADAALYRAKKDGRGCYRVMVASHLRTVAADESSAA